MNAFIAQRWHHSSMCVASKLVAELAKLTMNINNGINTNTYKSRHRAYGVHSHHLQTYTIKQWKQYSHTYHSSYDHRSLMLIKKEINAITFTATKKLYTFDVEATWSLSWQVLYVIGYFFPKLRKFHSTIDKKKR